MKKLTLIVERSDSGFIGRVTFNKNLIVDEARSLVKLEDKIKKLLKQFHALHPDDVKFEYRYDLTSLFEKFDYLKISNIAATAGINASLLRQYVTGNKQASASQAKKIESTLQKIGRELLSVQVYGKPE
jgi:hypothetical protein